MRLFNGALGDKLFDNKVFPIFCDAIRRAKYRHSRDHPTFLEKALLSARRNFCPQWDPGPIDYSRTVIRLGKSNQVFPYRIKEPARRITQPNAPQLFLVDLEPTKQSTTPYVTLEAPSGLLKNISLAKKYPFV